LGTLPLLSFDLVSATSRNIILAYFSNEKNSKRLIFGRESAVELVFFTNGIMFSKRRIENQVLGKMVLAGPE
jgi:hypothetical protein